MEKPFIDKPEGPAPTDLVIEDITVGDGAEAVAGGVVKVHYLGGTLRRARSSTRPGTAARLRSSRSPA